MSKIIVNVLGNTRYSKEHRIELTRNQEVVEMTTIVVNEDNSTEKTQITLNKAGLKRLKNSLNLLIQDF